MRYSLYYHHPFPHQGNKWIVSPGGVLHYDKEKECMVDAKGKEFPELKEIPDSGGMYAGGEHVVIPESHPMYNMILLPTISYEVHGVKLSDESKAFIASIVKILKDNLP